MKTLYSDALDPIPEGADLVSAGFPCDDASALHPRSSTGKHRLCVSEAGGAKSLLPSDPFEPFECCKALS